MSQDIALPFQSSDSPLEQAIDRWIWVFMAALFIAITLTGFIPDSLAKVAAVQSGRRPPFSLVLHLHAVLMGAFLLLLLSQSILMATGRRGLHMLLGGLAFFIIPALVVVGFLLVPQTYRGLWYAAQAAPPPVQANLREILGILENIALLQLRSVIVLVVCVSLALRARRSDAESHKRLMFLATVVFMSAAFDRMTWLPTTMPNNPIAADLYTLLAISPMLVWDLYRKHSLPRAYKTWLGVFVPVSLAVHLLWDKPGWHAIAAQMLSP